MESNKPALTRRDFIRGTVGATLAASMTGVPWVKGQDSVGASSLVTVVRDKSLMDSANQVDKTVLKSVLEKTIRMVSGKDDLKSAWLTLVKSDDTVGLVTTPHLNPTHEELVEVVTASLMEVVGIPADKIVMAQGGKRRPGRCTALISMPALKAHWLTGIGTVMKNYIMYSGRPSEYHEENSAKLGEIWLRPEVKGKTRLILVDAMYPLCDKGPQPDPRYKWAYNGLIAGTDPVAVETICLKIITNKRTELRKEPWPLSPPPLCVEAADKIYGLGTSDPARIRIEHAGWETGRLV